MLRSHIEVNKFSSSSRSEQCRHRGSISAAPSIVTTTTQRDHQEADFSPVSETESLSSGEVQFRDEVRAIEVERALSEYFSQVRAEEEVQQAYDEAQARQESQQRELLAFAEEVQEERSQERERTLSLPQEAQERERTLLEVHLHLFAF